MAWQFTDASAHRQDVVDERRRGRSRRAVDMALLDPGQPAGCWLLPMIVETFARYGEPKSPRSWPSSTPGRGRTGHDERRRSRTDGLSACRKFVASRGLSAPRTLWRRFGRRWADPGRGGQCNVPPDPATSHPDGPDGGQSSLPGRVDRLPRRAGGVSDHEHDAGPCRPSRRRPGMAGRSEARPARLRLERYRHDDASQTTGGLITWTFSIVKQRQAPLREACAERPRRR